MGESCENATSTAFDGLTLNAMDETVAGPANDATEFLPPTAQPAPELAWSSEEPATLALPRPWRSAWALAALGVLAAVVVAASVMAFATSGRQGPAPADAPYRSPAGALPPGSPTPAPKPPVDDDEFVAVAISPPDVARTLADGTGTAGSQERANEIALDECRGVPGNTHCILVNLGMWHGCVAFALDASRNAWASGSAPSAEAARSAAMERLGTPASGTGVQCSSPPGILRLPPP